MSETYFDYLKDSKNSLVREDLLTQRLMYDLKLAAVKAKYPVKIYRPQVDIDGFDIIIDDGIQYRKFQLKSSVDAKTKKWEVHRTMMRPMTPYAEDYGLDALTCPSTAGGVIRIDVRPGKTISDNFEVDYYYSDINIVQLIALGRLRTTITSKKQANDVIKTVKRKDKGKKVTIRQALFIKLKNADCLLSILGFGSIESYEYFDFEARNVIRSHTRDSHYWSSKKEADQAARDFMRSISFGLKQITAEDFSLSFAQYVG